MTRTLGDIGVTLLEPLFGAYAAVSHRRVRAGIADALNVSIPVCSVGNIAFGGTSKTPMVQYLAGMLHRNGLKPGVVIRGWKGQLDREGKSSVVSDGHNLFLEWKQSGDEARLLAESLFSLNVPVAIGRDRFEASNLLLGSTDIDVIILDDGFQYTRLARDLDLVLMDSMCPFGRFGSGSGPLREPVTALERADAVILTRTETVDSVRIDQIKKSLRDQVENLPPVFTARTTVHDVREGDTGTGQFPFAMQGNLVVALSGIANPLSFKNTLADLGCDIAQWFTYPDHYPFKEKDLARINEVARRVGAKAAITTSKDAIRLNGMENLLSIPVHVVEIRLSLEDESTFVDFIMERLSQPIR
jgi:tetraacyldisaccharide 4'-kinase